MNQFLSILIFLTPMMALSQNEKVPHILKWPQSEGATSYAVEISRKKDMLKVNSFESKKNRFFLMVYPGKDYYWTYEPVSKKKEISSRFKRSEVLHFNVEPKAPTAKKIEAPKEEKKELKPQEMVQTKETKESREKVEPLKEQEQKQALKEKPKKEQESFDESFRVSFGAGASFIDFGQSIANGGGVNTDFSLTTFPSFFLKVEAPIYEKFKVSALYSQTPGESDGGDQGNLLSAETFWQRIDLNGQYRLLEKGSFLGKNTEFSISLGLSSQTGVFVTQEGNDIRRIDNGFTSLSLGGHLSIDSSESLLKYGMSFHHHFPVSSDFNLSSSLILDASLDVTVKLTQRWHLGGYLQVQSYQSDFEQNASSGSQSYFNIVPGIQTSFGF